jgi:hypothetical protein
MMGKLVESFETAVGKSYGSFTVEKADEFSYTDPETQEVTEKQGLRFMAADGTRFVFRLSGTASANGATDLVCICARACARALLRPCDNLSIFHSDFTHLAPIDS